jgi:hypothetical protein
MCDPGGVEGKSRVVAANRDRLVDTNRFAEQRRAPHYDLSTVRVGRVGTNQALSGEGAS